MFEDGHNTIVMPIRGGPLLLADLRETPAAEMMQYTQAKFNLDDIVEEIWQQVRAVHDRGLRPAHIILGADFFHRFIENLAERELQYMHFQVPHDFNARVQPDTFRAMFRGCEVHCIPWMLGCVVLPDLGGFISQPAKAASSVVRINDWIAAADGELVSVVGTDVHASAPVVPDAAQQILQGLQDAFKAYLERPCKAPFLKLDKRWWEFWRARWEG